MPVKLVRLQEIPTHPPSCSQYKLLLRVQCQWQAEMVKRSLGAAPNVCGVVDGAVQATYTQVARQYCTACFGPYQGSLQQRPTAVTTQLKCRSTAVRTLKVPDTQPAWLNHPQAEGLLKKTNQLRCLITRFGNQTVEQTRGLCTIQMKSYSARGCRGPALPHDFEAV